MFFVPQTNRRFVRVDLPIEHVAWMVYTDWDSHNQQKVGHGVIEGLPASARLIGATTQSEYYPPMIGLIFEDESFAEVEPGARAPLHHVQYYQYLRDRQTRTMRQALERARR